MTMTSRPGDGRAGRTWVILFGVFLLLDFVLIVVMLITDKNLQTDFGGPKYFAHWWGLLAEGILTLLVALSLIFNATARSMWSDRPRRVRGVVIGSLVWTVLVIVANLAIVFSWKMAGFSSMSQFAMYLFDTASPAATGYIPWLYDALLGLLIVTAIVGLLAFVRVRTWGTAPRPA